MIRTMNESERVFVTGGTGWIGRAVVERLLRRRIPVVLMLREGAEARRRDVLEALARTAEEHAATITWENGDLRKPGLGLSEHGRRTLGSSAHVFHVGAIYELDATAEALTETNVGGTQRLLEALDETGFRGRLHHVSSTAVAGNYAGTFSESMFDEGQKFLHPYLRSKHEAERLVRGSALDYRIYRPSSVVGDSKTGAMHRIDGIYYGFGALQKLAAALPSWVRIPVPRVRGRFNVVPVDYVAEAMVEIALRDVDKRVFHLVDPKPQRVLRMVSTLLRAARGPAIGPVVDLGSVPGVKQTAGMASMLPSVQELRAGVLRDFGLPEGALDAMNLRVRFDDEHTRAALAGTDIRCPHFKSYAKTLYRYYEDHLDTVSLRDERYRKALDGRTVLITGASRGIGAATARIAARAGARVLLVARGQEPLDALAAEIRQAGGRAHVYATDLSALEEVDALAQTVLTEHGGVDVLVHNAARSIRRPAIEALDRFHDYQRTMALNYFSPVRLTLGLLPSLSERGGTISLVLTMGVLIPGPYFGAYQASKAALDAFGDSLISEMYHQGMHLSSVYLPLVKTEMMAPTEEYAGRVDVMTPEDAAFLIVDGIVDRKRRVMTREGRYFGISNRLTPMTTTRVLNLLRRTFPTADAKSEFPVEAGLITKAIGGSPF